jgi:hypothetical protein
MYNFESTIVYRFFYFQRIERIAPVPAETATDKKEPSRTEKSEDPDKCDKVTGSLWLALFINNNNNLSNK